MRRIQRKFLVEDDRNTASTGFGGSSLDAIYIAKQREWARALDPSNDKLHSTMQQALTHEVAGHAIQLTK